MKTIVIMLCMILGGCGKCAYGYSSACGADDAYEQQQKDQEDKDNGKEKEKAPSASWN